MEDLRLVISKACSDLAPYRVCTRSENTSLLIWKAICDLGTTHRRCNLSERLRTAFSVGSVGSSVVINVTGVEIIQWFLRLVVHSLSPSRIHSFRRWEDKGIYEVCTMCFPVSLVVFSCGCTVIQGIPLQKTTESSSRHMGDQVRVSGVDRVRSTGCDEL